MMDAAEERPFTARVAAGDHRASGSSRATFSMEIV